MNAQQIIKLGIIELSYLISPEKIEYGLKKVIIDYPEKVDFSWFKRQLTAENIDYIFSFLCDTEEKTSYIMQEAYDDFRYFGQGVDINPVSFSSHYEIDTKAKLISGQWVCWDFFYGGGGKYSNPKGIDLLSTARLLDFEGKEVRQTILKFTVKE